MLELLVHLCLLYEQFYFFLSSKLLCVKEENVCYVGVWWIACFKLIQLFVVDAKYESLNNCILYLELVLDWLMQPMFHAGIQFWSY